MTSLISALKAKDLTKVAEIFQEGQFDTEEEDENGSTPLHLMAVLCWKEGAEFLIASGADINRRNKFGATPLYFAAKHGCEGVAEALLEAGADPHICNQNNVSPHDIAKKENHTRVAALIGHYAARTMPGSRSDSMVKNILDRKKR